MTKIAIAEPSIMLRIGLEQLLRELPDAEVVFSTDNLGSLYARINALRPDILIVNPLLYDYAKRATIRAEFDNLPNLRLIGLVTSYVESQHQRQFATKSPTPSTSPSTPSSPTARTSSAKPASNLSRPSPSMLS